MAILDFRAGIWREALGLSQDDTPAALILEGTWWWKTATKNRLGYLEDVRELAFPDMYLGRWKGETIAYCCAYGAARAVEPAHVFAQLGTKLLIQIGTCGSLDVRSSPGDIVLPSDCAARDGIAHAYGAGSVVRTHDGSVAKAEALLRERGMTTDRVYHLTWPSLFAQSDDMCKAWAAEGLKSIDMETSAVVAVADHFGASAVSMLSVWDALQRGRTFLDPMPDEDAERLKRANEVVYEVALALAKNVEIEP